MLFYRAALPLSRQTLTFVSDLIRVHRREIGMMCPEFSGQLSNSLFYAASCRFRYSS
jgi:hypothetical protein